MVKGNFRLGASRGSGSIGKRNLLGRSVFFNSDSCYQAVTNYNVSSFTDPNLLLLTVWFSFFRFINVEEIQNPVLILVVGVIGLVLNLTGLCMFICKFTFLIKQETVLVGFLIRDEFILGLQIIIARVDILIITEFPSIKLE